VLNAIPATAGAVNSTYIAGGAALANIGAGGLTQTYLGTNVAGTGPAFSAYLNSTQSISAATITKVTLSSEEFDTNNNFDSATNYRFTPTVTGYYQINCNCYFAGTANPLILFLYKNGALYKEFFRVTAGNATGSGSSTIYFNGSTDYVEMYVYVNSAMLIGSSGTSYVSMSGAMVRSA
jgi:hypothetical protein